MGGIRINPPRLSIFEAEEWAPVVLSTTQRRTRRQRAYITNGIHPATRVPLREVTGRDDRCGDCAYAVKITHNSKSYWKCGLVPMTKGAATDIRVSWPACVRWKDKHDTKP